MEKSKMFAITAAFMMLAVAGIAVVGISDDSDATSTGSVKVYYYNENSSQWASASVIAYNLYIAVNNAASNLGYTVSTNNANWSVGVVPIDNNPNKDYGLITAVNNSTNFKIYGYNNADEAWNEITNYPLGWFRPYVDYTAVNVDGHYAAYANVAIVTQDGQGGYHDYTTIEGMIDLTSVQSASNMYSFTIRDDSGTIEIPEGSVAKMPFGSTYDYQPITTQMVRSGVTVYGFGSDAYLALIDAVGAELVGQMTAYIAHTNYYTYYSWMTSLYNMGTEPIMDGSEIIGYKYWELTDTSGYWVSWTLGYYSIEHPDSAQHMTAFNLTYVESYN
ncbi:hypothetical protein PED39_01980 [Methanomassiliicoccales archaeon LGM-RCC1]|nr:hypothetical protein PED39_01980 [Methanomassiliicoccales archaeon LGM-RCC1]